MAAKFHFSHEEMAVDETLGYPKAYAKLCRGPNVLRPYSQGPPLSFVPYTLQPQEALRAKDFNQMFPVIDSDAVPSVNPRGFVNLLWKQLDHLGNAGFDPALFRVDPYGNVLYLHADQASPLAWDIDHWFPCSRGGKTVPGNLRVLQWQVCKKKQNKLDFLIPWWVLQSGISVNQFLSIFASKNSDFRIRAFAFIFSNGANEELNALQSVDSHSFPQHFIDMKRQVGLGPAAIVSSQRNSDASVLKPLNTNSSLRPKSPFPASRKTWTEEDEASGMAMQRFGADISKENDDPNVDKNPYLSISIARDSLRQREESKKKQAEISRLEAELAELKQSNEKERITLQDMEVLLIQKRRRVEKCRRLAEAQSSYKAMLEKMIRDAMHQSVVYKEQVRMQQAATSALMARLDAQRAMCDSSEKELHKRFMKRDEVQKQIEPGWEHARKRSRTDDMLLEEEREEQLLMFKAAIPLKKELRVFLEEEHKASEAGQSVGKEEDEDEDDDDDEGVEEQKASHTNEKLHRKHGMPFTDDTHMKSTTGIGHCTKNGGPQKCLLVESPEEGDREECRDMTSAKDFESKKKGPFVLSLQDKHQRTRSDTSYDYSYGKLKKVAEEEGQCRKSNEIRNNSLLKTPNDGNAEKHKGMAVVAKDEKLLYKKLEKLAISEDGSCSKKSGAENLFSRNSHNGDDEEHRYQVGKGNVEKWLKLLLDNMQDGSSLESPPRNPERLNSCTDEIVRKTKNANPKKEIKYLRLKSLEGNTCSDLQRDEKQIIKGDTKDPKDEAVEVSIIKVLEKSKTRNGEGYSSASKDSWSRKSFDGLEKEERRGGDGRCESSRGFRSFPSSPSVILSMKKGVDCIGKKPKVLGDDDNDEEFNKDSVAPNNNFIKTCTRAIKKSMNI